MIVRNGQFERQPRILFVAMHDSPHTARWIEMIAGMPWDLHMFPLYTAPPNPNLCGVTVHQPYAALSQSPDPVHLALPPSASSDASPAQVVPFAVHANELAPGGDPYGRVSLGEAGETAQALHGPRVLASLIDKLKPDIVHSMEFQHGSYLVLQCKALVRTRFPLWLATNWGSDIFYFGRQNGHRIQIERMLGEIDFYSCECHRDIFLAQSFGYRGPVLTVLPNTGGFNLEHVAKLRSGLPPSRRKRIMVKGYEHFAGRAMRALAILEEIADQLKDFEVVLYSVGEAPLVRAIELNKRGTLKIKIVGWATHDEMLAKFGSARVYLGLSISDAISTSVLEAMSMGAFPIQTNTSCCDEWFDDGIGGFIVSPVDNDMIKDRLLRALADDELVDTAAQVNQRTVTRRLDRDKLGPRVVGFYQPVFDRLRHSSKSGRRQRDTPLGYA